MKATTLLLSLPLIVGACTDPSEPDEPAESIDPAAAPEANTVLVRTPAGLTRIHYAVVNGHAIYDGDIDLGPVEQVQRGASLWGGAVHKDFSRRWPDGVVRYRYHSNVSSANRTVIQTALDKLAATTPLTFVNVFDNTSGAYIEYRMDVNDSSGGSSDQIGMNGGGQSIVFHDESFGTGLVTHETLHAIGFFHEQSRPDRDQWVNIYNDCINWSLWDWENDQKQYEIKPDSLALGPYDFKSIMHYGTGTWCVDPIPAQCKRWWDIDQDASTPDQLGCDTMLKASNLQPIPAQGKTSGEDLNMLWRMYNRSLGVGEYGDRFAAAMVAADFNGDGYTDLAVGIPGKAIGGHEGAGKVQVFRGTSNRLVPWQVLTQSMANWSNEEGDNFGASLAAGDVDLDGRADPLVGIPGEDVGNVVDAGGAILFGGSQSGFSVLQGYTQSESGAGLEQEGDRFGAAVAIAFLAGNDSGVRDVIIGAPGDRVSTRLGVVASGAVYVFHPDFTGAIAATPTRLTYGGAAGDDFGATLAVGGLDSGINTDLVIGAPNAGVGHHGAIFVYAGRSPEGPPPGWTSTELATFKQRLDAPAGADGFGRALVIGNLRGDGLGEIAVGAPYADGNAGAVYIYALGSTTLGSSTVSLVQTVQQNAGIEAGDMFGTSLAVGNLNTATSQLELAVGAHGENSGEGAVSVFRGNTGDLTGWQLLRQADAPGGVNESWDWFGASVAIGNFDGIGESNVSTDQFGDSTRWKQDLAVGAWGESVDAVYWNGYQIQPAGPSTAGLVTTFKGNGSTVAGHRHYHQGSVERD